MKKLLLLGLLLLSGCKSTTSVYQKLKDGEMLFVSLVTNQHFKWYSDEINWYKVEKGYHLIVDIKGDPTTAYFPFDNIATWGIEK